MKIIIQTLSCSRCGHSWIPRRVPLRCPTCHSHNWDKSHSFDKRKKEYSTRSYERKSKKQKQIIPKLQPSLQPSKPLFLNPSYDYKSLIQRRYQNGRNTNQ